MNQHTIWRWLGIVVMVAGWHTPAFAELSVSLTANSRQVAVGETLELEMTVSATGGGIDRVELPKLNGFEIVSRREYRPIEIQFGLGSKSVYRSSINYALTIRAMRAGRYEIGPVVAMSGKTKKTSGSVTIQVTESNSAPTQPDPQSSARSLQRLQDPFDPQGEAADQNQNSLANAVEAMRFDDQAFIGMSADNKTPFVGEQVTLTLKLYTRLPLRASPIMIKEPSTEGFWLYNLMPPNGGPDPTRQIMQGAPFFVYVLRHLAAFPLRSGEISVGAPRVNLELGSRLDLFGAFLGGGSLEREGMPLTLQVKPIPDASQTDVRSGEPIAVGRFEMTASRDRDTLATGDALTLTVKILGQGNLRGTDLPSPQIPGVRVLAPETRDIQEVKGDKIQSVRTISWLLIPEVAGRHTVPAFMFAAFDPEQAKFSKVKSEPLAFSAVGPNLNQTTPVNPSDRTQVVEQSDGQAEVLPPIRLQSKLQRHAHVMPEWKLWLMCLTGVFLGWIASAYIARKNRNPARVKFSRNKKSRTSESALADLAQTLHAALELNLKKPTRALTRVELEQLLCERGTPADVTRQILSWLDLYESLRFSPTPPEFSQMKHAATELELALKCFDKKQ